MITRKKKINVVVLMGGPSSEHDISIRTGENILRHLDPRNYNLKPVTITKEGKWLIPKGYLPLPGGLSPQGGTVPPLNSVLTLRDEEEALTHIKNEEEAHVVFIAMHGEYGEDGKIQGFLDLTGIPYTGSGVRASSLGMHKPTQAHLFRDHGLLVPEFATLTNRDARDYDDILNTLGYPVIVKPADRGSSVGVSIANSADMVVRAVENAFTYSNEVMIQKYIEGRELTCGILDDGRKSHTLLLPTEIVPKQNTFFDYYSKYTAEATDEITPPNLDQKTVARIQAAALNAHKIIGARGFSRTDMMLDERGKIWILEINTIPGLTKESIVPKEAAAVGISFPVLLDRIIHAALPEEKRW